MAIKLGENSTAGETVGHFKLHEDTSKFYFCTADEIQEELIRSRRYGYVRHVDTVMNLMKPGKKWLKEETDRISKFDNAMKDAKRIAEDNYNRKKNLKFDNYSVG